MTRAPDSRPEGGTPLDVNGATLTADSLVAGMGQAGAMVIGTVLAVLLPRLMGVEGYGLWILFRSVILLLTTATMLGTQQVVSRFYGSWSEEHPGLAQRLFKTVALFRLVIVLGAALLAVGMLRRVGGGHFGAGDEAWAAVAVAIRGTTLTGLVLLYGVKAIGAIALMQVLLGCLAPLGVLAGYRLAGPAAMAPACAGGELLALATTFWLARGHLSWPRGWLPGARLRLLVRFGGIIALAGLGANIYIDAAICLAPLLGAGPDEAAYLGLATRLNAMLLTGLLTINRAMLPSFSRVSDRGQPERSARWAGLLTRAGAVLLMPAVALLPLLGRPAIRLVWGPAFEDALPIMILVVAGALPMWLSATHVTLAMIVNRPGVQLAGVGALYAGFGAILLAGGALPPAPRVALALAGGAAANCLTLSIGLRRAGCDCPRLGRLWLPLAVTALPLLCVRCPLSWAGGIGLGALWSLLFAAAVLASRFLAPEEIRLLARHAGAALGRRG